MTGVGRLFGASICCFALGCSGSADGADQPDTPRAVVYLFSEPVVCSELCAPTWDARIADGTQLLELEALGVSPATFPVVKTPTPEP